MEPSYSDAVIKLIDALSSTPVEDVPIEFTFDVWEFTRQDRHRLLSIPIIIIGGIPYYYIGDQSPSRTECQHCITTLRTSFPDKEVLLGYYNNFFEFEPIEPVSTELLTISEPGGMLDVLSNFDFGFETNQRLRLVTKQTHVRDQETTKSDVILTTPLHPREHPDQANRQLWRALRLAAGRHFQTQIDKETRVNEVTGILEFLHLTEQRKTPFLLSTMKFVKGDHPSINRLDTNLHLNFHRNCHSSSSSCNTTHSSSFSNSSAAYTSSSSSSDTMEVDDAQTSSSSIDPDIQESTKSYIIQKKFPASCVADWIPLPGLMRDPLVVAQTMLYGFRPSFELDPTFVKNFDNYPFKYYRREKKYSPLAAFLIEVLGEYDLLFPTFTFLVDVTALFEKKIKETVPDVEMPVYTELEHIFAVNQKITPLQSLAGDEIEPFIRTGYKHSQRAVEILAVLFGTVDFDYPIAELIQTMERYPHPNATMFHEFHQNINNYAYKDIVKLLECGPFSLTLELFKRVCTDPEVGLVAKHNAVYGTVDADFADHSEFEFDDNFLMRLFMYTFNQELNGLKPIDMTKAKEYRGILDPADLFSIFCLIKTKWCVVAVTEYRANDAWIQPSLVTRIYRYKLYVDVNYHLFLEFDSEIINTGHVLDNSILVNGRDMLPVTTELLPYLCFDCQSTEKVINEYRPVNT